MSFRQPDIQAPNALAQFAQIQQIQGGQQAQELARFQLGAAQRSEATQNAINNAYAQSVDPATGTVNYNKLTGLLAAGGGASQIPAIEKTRREIELAALNAKNTQSQIDEREFGLQKKKLDFAWKAVGDASTPEDAIAQLTKGAKDGMFDMKSVTSDIQKLQKMTTPEEYRQFRAETMLKIVDAKDKLGFMLPKTRDRDTGGFIQQIQDNPFLPGYSLPVQGMAPIAKTATIGERTAQGQLALAQQKFAFEKANPGFELKEDADGNFYGVNKRTLQAIPVMVGGAAPAAAPATPSAGMPGPRVPAPAIQAIPGMTSVLDQPAPAAAAPASLAAGPTQLRGKGQGLTEGERKASTLLQRMQFSQGQLTQALLDDPNAAKPGLFTSALDMLSTPAANTLTSEARQRVASAQLDILDAALTLGTGAAYTKDQLEGYRKSYFPQIGDGPQQIKDKKARLENVISAAKIAAGKGAALVPDTLSGASATNPLGLPGIN
jgi:hypothetical protein